MIFRLCYLSEAVGSIGLQDLRVLERDARERNAALDVTGAMCLIDGHFVQVLEGDRLTVSRLFERIAADPRHVDVEVLGAHLAPRRWFERWSMRVAMVNAPSATEEAYRQVVGHGAFDRSAWEMETALVVLDKACREGQKAVSAAA